MNRIITGLVVVALVGAAYFGIKWVKFTPKYVAVCTALNGMPMVHPNITSYRVRDGVISLYSNEFNYGATMVMDADRCMVSRRETN